MTIYCLYGVGKETERAYYYQEITEKCSNVQFTINTQVIRPVCYFIILLYFIILFLFFIFYYFFYIIFFIIFFIIIY